MTVSDLKEMLSIDLNILKVRYKTHILNAKSIVLNAKVVVFLLNVVRNLPQRGRHVAPLYFSMFLEHF